MQTVNARRVVDFIQYLNMVGRRQAAETYYYLFKRYASFLGVGVENLSTEHINTVNIESYTSNMNPNSANTFIAAVRSYLKYLKKTSATDEEYYKFAKMMDTLDVGYKKVPKVITKKALTPTELRILFDFLEGDRDEVLYSVTVVYFYLGCRAVELAQKFDEGVIDFTSKKAKRMIDFDNMLISIITAKTGDQRIIPIDKRVLNHFEVWFENLDEILSGERPREWLTRRLRTRSKYLGFKVTAKTARRTFETRMRLRKFDRDLRVNRQFYINYFLGHTTSIPDVYTDYIEAIEDIRENFLPNHYIFDVL